MSKKGLKEFMEFLKTKEELANKLKEIGSDVSKIIALGKEHGYEFGIEDFKSLQEELSKSNAEFSDEDLEKVAGGVVTAVVAACAAAAVVVAASVSELESSRVVEN